MDFFIVIKSRWLHVREQCPPDWRYPVIPPEDQEAWKVDWKHRVANMKGPLMKLGNMAVHLEQPFDAKQLSGPANPLLDTWAQLCDSFIGVRNA
eukprot:Cvel_6696.t1-p1 / transcript=Cvel_6696.t1 / gene=Cvel_6696 / organism=Chromera_velia_CCMP2878 / gene_product=hypothetical protein / transcript_product=hypothetical protein / location=Cvel_scaffold333:97216-97794(+) / protein_length=93 / sequence_SO=supercontig / SO=protein_coding / is_pseudo=false